MRYKYFELNKYKVRVSFDKYANNQSLAVKLITDEEDIFAVVSVNLTESWFIPKNSAFIDVNNCPFAEKFLIENNIAKPVGIYSQSGFCSYPLYDFSQFLKLME